MQPWRLLPAEFGELLLAALDPTKADEAAALIARAAALDDVQLEVFLVTFERRARSSPAPVTVAELRSWLDALPPAGEDPRPPT